MYDILSMIYNKIYYLCLDAYILKFLQKIQECERQIGGICSFCKGRMGERRKRIRSSSWIADTRQIFIYYIIP